MSGKPFNTVFPADYSFWELLNQVVQEEPTASLDPIRLGFFQSIGIQKGKPFAPDERMKKILTEAAAVGDATARTILFHTREKAAYYYPDSNWQLGFIGGYKFETQPGVLDFDAATFYYFLAILVTPAMEEKMIGKGSQYAWTARDANGNPLDGGKNYKLHLPPNVPVKDFWSEYRPDKRRVLRPRRLVAGRARPFGPFRSANDREKWARRPWDGRRRGGLQPPLGPWLARFGGGSAAADLPPS